MIPVRPPAPPKRRFAFGCAGCGCTLLIVVLLLLGALAYGVYHLVVGLTQATATPVPTADSGPAVYAAAQKKIEAFRQAVEYGQPAALRLDSDEINTFITRDPSMASVRGHLAVHLQDGHATLQTDLRLGDFENLFLRDRYIDSTAILSFVFHPEDSSIVADLQSLSLQDQPVPASSLSLLNQSLNNALEKQIEAKGPVRDFLAHTQKIAIENDELVIVTR